jgi:hypothetical protein
VAKWITDVKQAGATSIYVVMDATGMQRSGPTVIIPVRGRQGGGDRQADPDCAAAPARAGANPNEPQVVTVPGVGVMLAPVRA